MCVRSCEDWLGNVEQIKYSENSNSYANDGSYQPSQRYLLKIITTCSESMRKLKNMHILTLKKTQAIK